MDIIIIFKAIWTIIAPIEHGKYCASLFTLKSLSSQLTLLVLVPPTLIPGEVTAANTPAKVGKKQSPSQEKHCGTETVI